MMTIYRICPGMLLSMFAACLLLPFPGQAQGLPDPALGESCLIEANKVVRVSVQTPGTISRVDVVRGSRVKAGQVIAELESSVERSFYDASRIRADSDVGIRAKQAEFAAVERKLAQQKALSERGAVSQQGVDDLESQRALSRMAVEQAQLESMLAKAEAERLAIALDRRIVRSPVDGVVTAIGGNPGEYLEPTQPLFVIHEIQPLRVEVYLPIAMFKQIEVGMQAQVSLEEAFQDKTLLKAVVVTKDPAIDATSGTFQVGLRMDNPGERIPAGLRCSISFSAR